MITAMLKVDLEMRLRRRECDARARALVTVRWSE
jgi:hypothetical protein